MEYVVDVRCDYAEAQGDFTTAAKLMLLEIKSNYDKMPKSDPIYDANFKIAYRSLWYVISLTIVPETTLSIIKKIRDEMKETVSSV